MRQGQMKIFASLFTAAAIATAALTATPNAAQTAQQRSVSLRDTFPVGSNGLCEAQIMPPERGAGLFDRRYSVICRDAAAPIGTLWVVRGQPGDDVLTRFGSSGMSCNESSDSVAPEGLSGTRRLVCTHLDNPVRTELLIGTSGNRTFAASGLSAYNTALELGLASLMADRVVSGTVEIPLTQATDALAFARQQAETIAADQALIEAYRRSNSGNFAEAAEFFAASSASLTGNSGVEAQLNEGLLQSNLGNYVEARRLFAQTRQTSAESPVLARLQRNYEAIDALNQSRHDRALQILDLPLTREFGDGSALRELRIGPAMANRLAGENGRVAGDYTLSLTPLERAQLLDGQAEYLRATALRLSGRPDDAVQRLEGANTTLAEVRGGRVTSIIWLRAQVLGELAEVAERSGRAGEALNLHQQGIALLELVHPGSPALQSAQAQLAGFFARNGRRDDALGLYRDIVAQAEGRPLPTLRGLMAPYFDLLLDNAGAGAGNSDAATDMFAASQLLQRPGLAQTQAVLARELSAGSDEAAQLFRKTTNLGRAIEQLRLAIAQMQTGAELSALEAEQLAERQQQLEQLQQQQAALLQALAEYPRYRAAVDNAIDLSALQQTLREDEAYVKLVALDRETFVIYATPSVALAYRADATPAELERLVTRIRESIAVVENGQVLTYPFDIARARELYVRLFAPVADRLPGHRHIVFEPDGALLKLPINLLVIDDDSVERYRNRLAGPDGDEYDFRDTAWLGRASQISTSVSASAFRDVRESRPSSGTRAYLGLGENVPVGDAVAGSARTRSALAGGENCLWSPNIWANPIKADELFDAASRFGSATRVLTKDQFTDSAIRAMDDLAEYRILHFATHGLVTAPQPECPPRPALLTSFGTGDSDGLLSFAEIFGLRIDADLVILSACDTAGSATIGATRDAGVTTGGDFALDGLVRAFVGAGGRTVLASHWPVPDDFDATQRLVSGLFANDGSETAGALQRSQIDLMNDPDTSHPFYWSAFAVVGDGAIQLNR